MTKPTSTPYDRRIHELRRRTRHPVRRRLLDSLTARRVPIAQVTNMMGWLDGLMDHCERIRTHGAVPLAFARGLLSRTTYGRYLPLLLSLEDGQGGHDFVLNGDTLHICRLRHSAKHMARAEVRWAERKAYERDRKRAYRAVRRGQAAPNTMAQTPPSGPEFESVPHSSSLREENLETQDSAGTELCSADELFAQAIARAEAADAAVAAGAAVGSVRPQAKRALSSLEVTEAALAEERALQAANKVEVERDTVPTPKPRCGTVPEKLARWGWDASRARRHRFTEGELAAAVEKVERARRPIGNRAGAVAKTILRWRSGEWSMGRAA